VLHTKMSFSCSRLASYGEAVRMSLWRIGRVVFDRSDRLTLDGTNNSPRKAYAAGDAILWSAPTTLHRTRFPFAALTIWGLFTVQTASVPSAAGPSAFAGSVVDESIWVDPETEDESNTGSSR